MKTSTVGVPQWPTIFNIVKGGAGGGVINNK